MRCEIGFCWAIRIMKGQVNESVIFEETTAKFVKTVSDFSIFIETIFPLYRPKVPFNTHFQYFDYSDTFDIF